MFKFIWVIVLIAIGTTASSQEHNASEKLENKGWNLASKDYTETDFIKMQEHYKRDNEVIEMMKLKSMAGSQNAAIFLEFLNLSYEQARLKYGSEVVASVIYTYYESTALLDRFQELNDQLPVIDSARATTTKINFLTPSQYHEQASILWNEYVPKSGQSEVVAGELLRAIEKLRDEAQRNANINFHDGCHNKLIAYLRLHLIDTELFDARTLQTILDDLQRLEREEQPYTADGIYNRLTNRVVDWFLHYGAAVVHKENTNLPC